MFALDEGDVRVRGNEHTGLRHDPKKWVVRGVKNKRGDGNAIKNAGGSGTVIVVIGAGEAGVKRGNAVVEFADGAKADGQIGIERTGKERSLPAEPTVERAEKLDLVEAIDRCVERIGGGTKVNGWRHADDGVEFRWCIVAQFARQLEDEVAAHGVAEQGHGLEVIQVDEIAHDNKDVTRETGVVESRGERFSAAAVAHIHAHDVAAALPQLIGVADDILRVGRE